MPIYELQLTNLGPFDEIQCEFDPEINVFVGPNNCGKTTALLAVAHTAVRQFLFPDKLVRKGAKKIRVCEEFDGKIRRYSIPITFEIGAGWRHKYGDLWDQGEWLGFGCFIPALRSSTDYRAEAPAAPKRSNQGPVPTEETAGPGVLFEPNASVVRDEALIQKIINLDYRSYREKNRAIREVVGKIAAIASEITDGFPIEFAGVDEDDGGLYPAFKTPDGVVPINVLSQGTQSILQWLGMLLIGYAEHYDFPENLAEKPGVVIIDEIDAHMHPSWQRRILPTLSRNFPKLQIFCSSHSPFVLAGLKTGQAQLLKRDHKGKVVVSRNPSDIVGWSMDEILRNFLDISNPTDLQTSQNIERLQELRGKKRLTRKQKEELEHLRETLNQDLLAGPVSSDMERLAERLRNAAAQPPSRRKTTPAKKKTKKVSAVRTRRTGAKRAGRQR